MSNSSRVSRYHHLKKAGKALKKEQSGWSKWVLVILAGTGVLNVFLHQSAVIHPRRKQPSPSSCRRDLLLQQCGCDLHNTNSVCDRHFQIKNTFYNYIHKNKCGDKTTCIKGWKPPTWLTWTYHLKTNCIMKLGLQLIIVYNIDFFFRLICWSFSPDQNTVKSSKLTSWNVFVEYFYTK